MCVYICMCIYIYVNIHNYSCHGYQPLHPISHWWKHFQARNPAFPEAVHGFGAGPTSPPTWKWVKMSPTLPTSCWVTHVKDWPGIHHLPKFTIFMGGRTVEPIKIWVGVLRWYPKSPWVSILERPPMTWKVWGSPVFGTPVWKWMVKMFWTMTNGMNMGSGRVLKWLWYVLTNNQPGFTRWTWILELTNNSENWYHLVI